MPPTGQPILDLGSNIQDFADTAAIVAQLDLVICIDTAIAHLVGALNIPCWVLLPAIGVDWRWLQERTDSPWYPGVMRLFRQTKSDDWSATIRDVAKNLKSWVDERASAI
jgi:ADP-heptose:LPS heptosyltransferase